MFHPAEIGSNVEQIGLNAVDTYVFDYGGVISFHYCEPWQSNVARLLKVSPETANNLLSETSSQGKAYREGKITRVEFWREVAKLAGAENFSYAELEDNWARSYQIDTRMLELIEQLRAERGFKIGIMMNTDEYRNRHIENEYQLSQNVDFVVSSFKHGVTKPNPEIYRITLGVADRLQTPGKVIYVDDKQRNITPCLGLGMKGYVFKSYEGLKDVLTNEGIIRF